MRRIARGLVLGGAAAAVVAATAVPAGAAGGSMADGENGFTSSPIHTVGDAIDGYTPPGVMDGVGAFDLDQDTVRVLVNHELGFSAGSTYSVDGGGGGPLDLTGSRVSYLDVDKDSRQIVDGGLAYDAVYDVDGQQATDLSFLAGGLPGFSRFCSANLVEAQAFGAGRGFEDRIFFTGEEDGGDFNPNGGAEWALDPANGDIWHLPDLGRGAWENVTPVDTGDRGTVALLMSDDTSPFDADGDGEDEAAPLYLYVGEKDPGGDFAARNGLRGGTLHVWVPRTSAATPADFSANGTLVGDWVAVDNERQPALAGTDGYDDFGYPTQRNLWTQAEALGAFGFSRPEDVATNPADGSEVVLASTGVDTYVGGADTFGTLYKITTNFANMKANARIIYDGDADPTRALRSPDNLDWADDGFIYVQEDKAEDDTLDGEPLFGPGAVNPNEASIVRMDENGHHLSRVAEIDRSVVLDPTTAGVPFDNDAGDAGEWETSGILDVSALFGAPAGSLFLFDVQAHGIEDQTAVNVDSRINDGDLVEGGQLLFLEAPARTNNGRGAGSR
jgi:serralysin